MRERLEGRVRDLEERASGWADLKQKHLDRIRQLEQ